LRANLELVRYLVKKFPTIQYLIGHHEHNLFEGHPLWREKDESYRTTKTDPGDRFVNAVRAGVGDLQLKGVREIAAEKKAANIAVPEEKSEIRLDFSMKRLYYFHE